MMKWAAGLVLASSLMVPGAWGQAPSLIPNTKNDSKEQTPPAPVVAPLCVGTAFNAVLSDTLDTQRAKAGDLVTAEAAEDVTYERSVILPKGTRIVGRVLRVTSGGRGKAGSAIFVQFDKAVLKDGQEVMLNAGIQALAVGGVSPLPGDTQKNLETAPHALPVEENSGNVNGSSDALIVSTVYESPRSTLRAPLAPAPVAEGEFTSDGLFTPDSKGAFGRPDLKVYTPTSEGSHGTVLLSAKKNLHIDVGTHLLLVVQPPPSGASDAANPLDLDLNQ